MMRIISTYSLLSVLTCEPRRNHTAFIGNICDKPNLCIISTIYHFALVQLEYCGIVFIRTPMIGAGLMNGAFLRLEFSYNMMTNFID